MDLKSTFEDVTASAIKRQTGDFFTLKYLAAWAVCYVLFGAINIVFDHYLFWHEALMVVLFGLTVILGLHWSIRKYRWRTISALLALPVLWGCDFALTAIGVDAVQRSFWLTYPFYSFQVRPNTTNTFRWAENGFFLGGGWEYNLSYDPAATTWNKFPSVKVDDQLYAIGTHNKSLTQKEGDRDCQRQQIRHLGGSWYFQSFESGDGLC